MKNLFKYLGAFAALAVVALGVTYRAEIAKAAATAVGSTWSVTTNGQPWYNRSDGLFSDSNTKGVAVLNAGQVSQQLGKSFEELFNYGDDTLGTSEECLSTSSLAGAAYSTTLTNRALFCSGNTLYYEPLATQDLDLDLDADSLDIGGDQTASDGYELYSNMPGVSGNRPFKVGDDPAFQFCVTFEIADVSGTDDFQVGFRNAGEAIAGFDDYLTAATIGFNTSANPAAIKLATIDDNAATVETDTTNTLADATAARWCVFVSGTGVVTYTINGSAPSTTAAYTLDDDTMVIPFVRYLQHADLTGEFDLREWEVKYTE